MVSEKFFLFSPCCDAWVYVPVEVTAHLLVRRTGRVSQSIADTGASIRRQALQSEADPNEAYCSECGASVLVISLQPPAPEQERNNE